MASVSPSRGGAASPVAHVPDAVVSAQLTRKVIRAGMLILVWYIFSTAMNLFNREVVGDKYGVLQSTPFPLPVLLTSAQFVFQHFLARMAHVLGAPRTITAGEGLSWPAWRRSVLPNGAATGLDIGFTNHALALSTLKFVTMCKASSPLFLLIFAFAFRIESPTRGLTATMLIISVGLLMMSAGETDFRPLGFALVMTAAACSGLRWTLTQIQLQGGSSGGEHIRSGTALEVLETLTPVMAAVTAVVGIATEPVWHSLTTSVYFSSFHHVGLSLGLALFGGGIAFCLVWTEFALIGATSALVYSIVGTLKEILTVGVSELAFHDKLTALNAAGLGVVLLGVALFKYIKYKQLVGKSARASAALGKEGQVTAPGSRVVQLSGAPESGAPETGDHVEVAQAEERLRLLAGANGYAEGTGKRAGRGGEDINGIH